MPSRVLRLWNPDVADWEEVGDSRLTAHLAEPDPHPQYLTASEGEGGYVDEAGDTMTGTLVFQGAAVESGGAVRVVGPGVSSTESNLYGPGSTTLNPTNAVSPWEFGARFTSDVAQYLVGVRWYRRTSGVATPPSVRLWDSTATSTPVWSTTTPAAWADGAVGWKEHRLSLAEAPLLVAGRTYVVSFTGATGQNSHLAYGAPVPVTGLTFQNHVNNSTAGSYPTTTITASYGIDVSVRVGLTSPDPAESGALRLPNGVPGLIAWRNSSDAADLALGMDSGDRLALTVGTSALTTSATGGSATALPSQPVGYLAVVINGAVRRIPFYS